MLLSHTSDTAAAASAVQCRAQVRVCGKVLEIWGPVNIHFSFRDHREVLFREPPPPVACAVCGAVVRY